MKFLSYDEACFWLFSQFPAYHNLGAAAYNPGLKNTEELLSVFGNPHNDLRFIHVGGTNGKGSVSNMLTSVLVESGESVGCFTSPHIIDFSERIRVNGKPVEEQFVTDFCNKVVGHNWNLQPSFFEITWVMALEYFRSQKCTVVVAEVGLGGRLDATNVITPLLSIITNISLDHTNILGNTRAEIAFEKAGIIKPAIPVILGEMDDEVAPVFRKAVEERGSSIMDIVDVQPLPKEIIGYQERNYTLVKTAVHYLKTIGFNCSDKELHDGIHNLRKNTGFFGRLEIISEEPFTIVDCAHNEAGLKALFDSIEWKGNLHIVYGTSSDKDLSGIVSVLPKDANYYLTEFSNPRSASNEQLQQGFSSFPEKKLKIFKKVEEAYSSAQLFANKADTIVVCGSFFLAHDFFSKFSLK